MKSPFKTIIEKGLEFLKSLSIIAGKIGGAVTDCFFGAIEGIKTASQRISEKEFMGLLPT